jgi:hypothetical protein
LRLSDEGTAGRYKRSPVPHSQHLKETPSRSVHINDPASLVKTSAALLKSFCVTGRIVGIVVSAEGRGVVEEIGRFLEKRIASEHETDGVVGLQVEILRDRCPGGQSLPVPPVECELVRLKVEKRKPVGTISQKGPKEALFFSGAAHDNLS